eukprot:6203804-Pleurochrysis_carterae.AAC.2
MLSLESYNGCAIVYDNSYATCAHAFVTFVLGTFITAEELESTLSSLQGSLLPPISVAVDAAVASRLSVWKLARQEVEVKVLGKKMIVLDKDFDLAKASYGEASFHKANNAEAKFVEKASIVSKVRRARGNEAAEAVTTAEYAKSQRTCEARRILASVAEEEYNYTALELESMPVRSHQLRS